MILEKIKQYIDYKNISVSAFEKSIGMSNASFGKSLKNGGAIGTDKLEIILNRYPDLNIEWLFLNKGKMIKENEYKLPDEIPEMLIESEFYTLDKAKSDIEILKKKVKEIETKLNHDI